MKPIFGKWTRKSGAFDFYFLFHADGTFETDEIPGRSVASGTYKVLGEQIHVTTFDGDFCSAFIIKEVTPRSLTIAPFRNDGQIIPMIYSKPY